MPTAPRVGAWTASLGLVLAVLTAGVAAEWTPLSRLDTTVARRAFDLTAAHPASYDAWLAVSTYGGPTYLRLALVALGVVLLVRRRWRLGLWLLLTAVVESIVAPLSKDLLNRPRPSWPDPLVVERSTSYPSGHSAAAGMFAAATVLLAMAALTTRVVSRLLVGLGVAVGFLVPTSRVFLGVHYLSDVVGGLLLGALVTLLAWLLVSAVSSRARRREVPVFAAGDTPTGE